MENLFFLAIVAISMSFVSCGSDVDCDDEAAFEAAITTELDDLLTTAFAYAFDPTNSDACNAYKDAINAYVKAVEPYRECATGAELEEFDSGLAEIEAGLDDLDC